MDCASCHEKTTRNGKEFQEFSGIAFNDCVSCHQDPHDGQLRGSAPNVIRRPPSHNLKDRGSLITAAQTLTSGFTPRKSIVLAATPEQNRSRYGFPGPIQCAGKQCVACHKDVHNGQFGNDCVKCHRETSFLSLRSMDFFDHTKTDYPLLGKHTEVDCRQCHQQRYSAPIDFSACSNCHDDYHRGEFKEAGTTPDCATCHSLAKGFDYSFYTLEEHQASPFPLEGAHTATPCFACHISEDDKRWTFRQLGGSCADCHQDIHKGYIPETYYPGQDCTACHTNEAWASVNFDHSKTTWPLEGKHLEVACSKCHFIEINGKSSKIEQKFANLDTECASCHENIHGDTFAIEGVTDCARCHVTESWFPERIRSQSHQFPIGGKTCRNCLWCLS